MCATSLGEDTGGSIRFRAVWCGLVGLRPTCGLVSRYGVMQGVWSMDAVGPTFFRVGHAYEQATEWHTMRPTEA